MYNCICLPGFLIYKRVNRLYREIPPLAQNTAFIPIVSCIQKRLQILTGAWLFYLSYFYVLYNTAALFTALEIPIFYTTHVPGHSN